MIAFIKEEWEPEAKDIAWAKNLVGMMNDGGVWGAPDSGQVFQFHHDLKEIHLIKGDPNHIWFEQSKICFKKVGYTVLDKT